MSEKKFTSKDLIGQLKQVPDLAYDFSNEEVLEGIKFFIKYIGYTLDEQKEHLTGGPDFSATRKGPGTTNRIIGVLRRNMKEVADGVAQLKKIRDVLGDQDQTEYAIVTPPVAERHLIDYLRADNNKLARDLQDNGFMLWLCNPKEKTVFCPQGASRDKRVNEFFRIKPMGSFLMGKFTSMSMKDKHSRFPKEFMDSLEE